MTGKNLLIALVLLALTAPASAAQSRKKAAPPPPPPPPPPQFHVDVATRPIELQQIKRNVGVEAKIGELQVGWFACMGDDRTPIYMKHTLPEETDLPFKQAFQKEIAAAGYRTTEAQGSLFGTETKAELLVGAVVLDLTENICHTGGTVAIDAAIKVDWQVFDPLEKKLLYRVTNDSVVQFKEPFDNRKKTYRQLPKEIAVTAFAASAKAILADPAFVAAVRDPKGGPAADPGALFPEATNSQNAAPQIARLPLSKTAFKDQVPSLRAQVVTVLTPGGSGSAFFIADGLLLTNHHVIDRFKRVRLKFFGGREIEGEVVTSNAKRDVALIKAEGAGLAGLPLRLDNPELTSQVFVIGSPLGEKHEGSVTGGIVSAFRNEDRGPFIQSDVSVDHGNSGGPMFDDRGNVIGLVDLGRGGQGTVNLFIPIGDALRVLEIGFAP